MNNREWTIEIPPRRRWFAKNLAELWAYRDLIELLMRRDLTAVYKQTILGPFWFLLQPLMTTLVFAVIFSGIFKVQTGEVPPVLFYLSGIVAWNYFSSCLTKNAEVFIANSGLFRKVYFPRLVLPAANVAVNTVTFLIQFSFFMLAWFYYWVQGANVGIGVTVLFIPLFIVEFASFGFAVGLLVASLTVRYRDLAFLTNFALLLWMFVTPIAYPLSMVPERWQWLWRLNPIGSIVESFRSVFWGDGSMDPAGLLIPLVECVILVLLALWVFNRTERTFVDSV